MIVKISSLPITPISHGTGYLKHLAKICEEKGTKINTELANEYEARAGSRSGREYYFKLGF